MYASLSSGHRGVIVGVGKRNGCTVDAGESRRNDMALFSTTMLAVVRFLMSISDSERFV